MYISLRAKSYGYFLEGQKKRLLPNLEGKMKKVFKIVLNIPKSIFRI